uniref:Uncharacterized protein n=1 Tax=Trichuris muris TaxID=70415 RepID=A0A5S6R076_TRIMR
MDFSGHGFILHISRFGTTLKSWRMSGRPLRTFAVRVNASDEAAFSSARWLNALLTMLPSCHSLLFD